VCVHCTLLFTGDSIYSDSEERAREYGPNAYADEYSEYVNLHKEVRTYPNFVDLMLNTSFYVLADDHEVFDEPIACVRLRFMPSDCMHIPGI